MSVKTGDDRGDASISTFSLGDLLEMNLPVRRHLIVPWLRQGESSMVFAAPGVGKSLFALDIALSVAGGGKALNTWRIGTKHTRTAATATVAATNAAAVAATNAAAVAANADDKDGGRDRDEGWKVLYVDGEMPLDDIRDRATMLIRGKMKREHQKDERDKTGDDGTFEFNPERASRNLRFMARHHQKKALDDFVNLADDESRRNLLQQIQREKPDLVILDNLSTLAAFEDENAASAFNGPVDFLQRLKSTGTACILVHHTNKGGEEFRGSSRIATTFETLVLLKPATSASSNAAVTANAAPDRDEDRDGDGGDDEAKAPCDSSSSAFSLEWRKYRGRRDGSIQDGQVFILMTGGTGTGAGTCEAYWKTTDTEDLRIKEMVEAVRSEEYGSQKELAAALGISTPTLSRMKTRAMREGRISERAWRNHFKNAARAAATCQEGEDEHREAVDF